jgi:hypothetical protein
LAGHLLLGVAHVAILPPWEGFDETAHYSYLQQLADRGELPRLGTARMSTDVERYCVPVTAGVLAFWIVRVWMLTGTSALAPMVLRLGILLLVVGSIAGWWYFGNWQDYGVALGSATMIKLRSAGGLISGLGEKFTMTAWVRGHVAFLTILAWSGTWSLARPAYPYLAPMTGIVLLTTGAYLAALRRFPPAAVAWLPAWLVGSDGVGVQRPRPRFHRADRRGTKVLAYPRLAASAWVAGGILVLIGLASAWKASRALEDPARCA